MNAEKGRLIERDSALSWTRWRISGEPSKRSGELERELWRGKKRRKSVRRSVLVSLWRSSKRITLA